MIGCHVAALLIITATADHWSCQSGINLQMGGNEMMVMVRDSFGLRCRFFLFTKTIHVFSAFKGELLLISISLDRLKIMLGVEVDGLQLIPGLL